MKANRAFTAAALSVLPLGQPLLLGTLGITTATTAILLQAPAIAQDASAVARIAKAITVRIEGATQGSGVLVKKEGNRYTVLTAWHVVSGNRPGEELAIYTPDGEWHSVAYSDITRVEESDTALLVFSSNDDYRTAPASGRITFPALGFVAGYPVNSQRKMKLLPIYLVGRAVCKHQASQGGILYRIKNIYGSKGLGIQERMEHSRKLILNPLGDTGIGMSGGPILVGDGSVVGHHNGGLGVVSDWGTTMKVGYNRGSLVPNNSSAISDYYKVASICFIFDAWAASLSGQHSEASDYSLSAYGEDSRTLPHVKSVMVPAMLQAGRVGDLCRIHADVESIDLKGIDILCSGVFPQVKSP